MSYNEPRMPASYHDLIPEIKTILTQNPFMRRQEVRRRIMVDRDLPLDLDDSYWGVRGPSYRGVADNMTMFEGRFALAYRYVREGK